MPNNNPQAIRVANEKIRPSADRAGGLYQLLKALQSQAVAEDWATLFPADQEILVDGSETDGRTPITNQDVLDFVNLFAVQVTDLMEANNNALLNLVLKIAVNPLKNL